MGPTVHEARADRWSDQGGEGVARLALPQAVDVDRDVLRGQEAGERAARHDAAVEQDEATAAEREGMSILDRLERHPFLGEDELQAGGRLPQSKSGSDAGIGE